MVSDVDDPMIESDNDSDGDDAGQAFYAGAGQQVNIILWISMFLREGAGLFRWYLNFCFVPHPIKIY